MKISRYTFLFSNNDNELYLYNTLSNALIEIDISQKSLFESLIKKGQNIDKETINDDEFYDLLLDKRFIVANNSDEFLLYKSIISNYRNINNLNITIAPTMDCNYSCHYCFEKNEKKYISSEVIDSIVQYIKFHNDVNVLDVTWFGGEPLMAIDKMKEFYQKMKLNFNKEYKSNIITNGFFITPKILKDLDSIGIQSIQITLDGNKSTHNKIKFTQNCSDTFSKTIENIDLISKITPNIHISIRVNIDKKNSTEYADLYGFISERYKEKTNIGMSPAFVFDTSGLHDCDDCFSRKQSAKYVLDLYNTNNIHSHYIKYPEPYFHECSIRNKNVIAVDPEGFVYKCWEIIGKKEFAFAKLVNGKFEEMNFETYNRFMYGADPIDDEKCRQCSYLPICMGGCPFHRIENEFYGKSIDTCTYLKGFLPEFLNAHIETKKQIKKQ
ncbi:MAG: arylsulfatase regulator [Bacteroidetes bacterium]|nr:arylsulfatase regulator [Bacteroidota bacterium]